MTVGMHIKGIYSYSGSTVTCTVTVTISFVIRTAIYSNRSVGVMSIPDNAGSFQFSSIGDIGFYLAATLHHCNRIT